MTDSSSSNPIKATCHCGAITVTVPEKPSSIKECQCTFCRRYGIAWAYYQIPDIRVEKREGAGFNTYVWGDRYVTFNFCDNCHGFIGWWPIDEKITKMGVNTRNIDPEELAYVDREITYKGLTRKLQRPEDAHPEDKASY